MQLTAEHRIAILLHEGVTDSRGKTGLAMLRYSQASIVAVIDYQCARQSIPELTGIQREVPIVASVQQALVYKPNVLALGIAPSGGALPPAWRQEIKQAVAAGLSIVNGLHSRMGNDPSLAALLGENQWIWDVRQEPPSLTIGSGKARFLSCRRVLAVGTDMSVGKMSTNLELHRASLRRGLRSKVIATGQTNLMLGDDGVALDAVRVDFASGAIEQVVMRYGSDYDILYIEGQGSLLNPASTATLPLMRGSQPTHLVLAHQAGQTHIRNLPDVIIPPLSKVIHLYETIAVAGGAFDPVKVVGVALNTAHLNKDGALAAIEQTKLETGILCTDVIRFGADLLLDAILE